VSCFVQLFDLPTTVDPSYIISLIRKLLPPNQTHNSCSNGVDGNNSQKSSSDSIEEKRAPLDNTRVQDPASDFSETMDIIDDNKESACEEGRVDGESTCGNGLPKASTLEEVWEGNGCILWDLAASQTHAELMIENLVMDVLLANLTVSQSTRVREICLGILGNVACHEVLMKSIVSTKGLVDAIVDQLFLDDTQCLCEACPYYISYAKFSPLLVIVREKNLSRKQSRRTLILFILFYYFFCGGVVGGWGLGN
ncbi:uncharacterized protein LOC104453164, partial [Eucalyptus grandis]|uniref:uncharacterized protein LOC104453164 n=1 Tax=Eucalyptus grandis TaxID=71139 RepID=UPI00192EA8EE